jgi:hypothetical protein
MRVTIAWEGMVRKFDPGKYVIGRTSGCDIVLDEPSVSPRHAELAVGGSTVVLFDLRSATGVFVGGERVRQSRILHGRELLRIGSKELEITIRNETPALSADPDSSPSIREAPAWSGDGPPSSSDPREGTARGRALGVIGLLADRAIAAGRPKEAETMLAPRLESLLDDLRAGTSIGDSTCEAAVGYALRLAAASGDGRWLDYAIDLMEVRRATLDDDLAAELKTCVERAPGVNLAGLRRYLDSVGRLPPSIERIRTQHHLQQLMRTVGMGRAR